MIFESLAVREKRAALVSVGEIDFDGEQFVQVSPDSGAVWMSSDEIHLSGRSVEVFADESEVSECHRESFEIVGVLRLWVGAIGFIRQEFVEQESSLPSFGA